MPNPTTTRRRRSRLFRYLLVLVATPILIATNLLGTVPDNLLSSGVRQGLSLAFPAEFVDGLNIRLAGYELPTLPPAPEGRPADLAAGILTAQSSEENATPEVATEAAATQTVSSPTGTLVVSLSPTPQATLTLTPTLTLATTPLSIATPIPPDISGTWTYQYQFADHLEYTFEDVLTIEKQGSGYGVTSVTSNYGPVTLLDQYWNGSYLEFCYEIPVSTFPYERQTGYVDCVKTLRMENGHLIMIDELNIVREMTRSD